MFKKIKLQLIPSTLYFFYGHNDLFDFVQKNMTNYELDLNYVDAKTIGVNISGKGHHILIYVNDKDMPINRKIGLIAHELNHAKDFIYEQHGFNCQELGSYFIQYTLEEILNFLDKQGIK